MKIVKYFLSVILFTLFVSCESINSVDLVEKSGKVQSINGKLSNWNHGKDKKLLLISESGSWNNGDIIYSCSNISEDGSFMFSSISDATDKSLLNHAYPQFVPEAKISNGSFYCSDSSAMVAYSAIIIVQDGDTTNRTKGSVYRRNFDDSYETAKAGDFYTEYIYVNKNVTMNGTIKIDYYDDMQKKHWLTTYRYNIYYKKGWNRLVTYIASQVVTSKNGYKEIITERYFDNNEPPYARWDYSYYE